MPDPNLADTTPARNDSYTAEEGGVLTYGKYRLVAELGRGGMGVVYQAEDTLLRRMVALKVLPRRLSGDPAALERFLFEARAAATLSHPNIVPVYEIDEVGGAWFLVMELVSGGSAQAALRKRGPLPWDEAVAIVADACAGLAAAHAVGILHRDVKPANILLAADGVGKLADFGLAKALDPRLAGPYSGEVVLGTPGYMSPEQCRALPLDARSDLYSLGCTLHALLTGQAPFESRAKVEVLYAHCTAPRPDPRTAQPGVPAELVTLLHAALAIDPADRFASAGEMLQALDRVAALAVTASAPPSAASGPAVPPPLPTTGRHLPAARTGKVVPAAATADGIEPVADPAPAAPPGKPTRRWLLRGVAGASGLAFLLWVASRNKRTSPPAPVEDGPFWQRIAAEPASFRVGGPVSAVAVSPDLRWLAAASETAGTSVWDLTTGRPVTGLQRIKPDQGTRAFAFTPDGKTLLAGLRGSVARIGPATGEIAETVMPFPTVNTVSCLAFTPDGGSLVFGRLATERPGALPAQLFLLGLPHFNKEGNSAAYPAESFIGVTFVPRGREVVTLGLDGTVRAFDVPKLALLRTVGPEKPAERGRAFAVAATPTLAPENRPAGPYLAVADECGLLFRRADDWAKGVHFWPLTKAQPRSVAWSPTSRYLAAGASDGRVLFRDNQTGKVTPLAGHTAAVRAVAFSPQGTLLLTGSDDQTVRLTNFAHLG